MIIPPWEKIVETKTCFISWEEFHVTDKDLEFYDKVSPVFAGKKYGIPSPTLCPEERERRRLMYRNERSLYMRECDLTWQKILSMYPEESSLLVYGTEAFYSDDWLGEASWLLFNNEESFFSQYMKVKVWSPQWLLLYLRMRILIM